MTDPRASRPHFVPEIQGIRALAVGLVVAFHFWPLRLSGGYVGVDVFFVVSGFLITGILVRELASTGRVGLVNFYLRRARRLLPAAGVVLTVTAILALALLPLREWNQVFREVIGSALYVQNWVLAADGTDYFLQQDYSPSPVQHFWSLSVEEQFYLGWPVLLLAAGVLASRTATSLGRWLVATAGTITVASLILSVLSTSSVPESSYYWTHLRVWEFTAGGLLALFAHRITPAPWIARALVVMGASLIVFSALTFNGSTEFPGAFALWPVLGTLALLAATGADPAVTRRILGNPLAQWVGNRSYSIYLWHWPLLVFAPAVLDRDLSTLDKLLLIAVTLVLADLTKRFVEDRFRYPQREKGLAPGGPRRALVVTTAVAVIPAIAVALSGIVAGDLTLAAADARVAESIEARGDCFGVAASTPPCSGYPEPPPSELTPPVDLASRDDANTSECWSSSTTSALRVCSFGSDRSPHRIALVGDSHANQYLAAMHEIARTSGWGFDVMGKAGCMFTSARQVNNKAWVDSCESWKETVRAHLRDAQYDVIITSSYAGSPVAQSGGLTALETAELGLADEWESLALAGTQVVAIRDNPVTRGDYLECISRQTDGDYSDCAVSRDLAFALSDPQIGAVARVDNAVLFDPTDLLCGDTHCPVVMGGVIVYRDSTHLTSTLTSTLAPALRSAIEAAISTK